MSVWKLVNDSGVDYNFIRAFNPSVNDGDWLGVVVEGADDPVDGLLTVRQPGGVGTYTAPIDHFVRC